MDAPDYVLAGERVPLGPLRKDLADRYRRWVHDLDGDEVLMDAVAGEFDSLVLAARR